MKVIETNVYVDGFNFYYGAAKDTPFKWANLKTLCENVLPNIRIKRLRYFTALVKPTPADPQKRQRQEIYLRALETVPNLTLHYGHYLQSTVRMRLANPPAKGPKSVEVLKMEEKGSDVNIATYMLVDAFRHDCDQLVVVTNDSDLSEPVRIINHELGIPVGIFNPHTQDTADRKARKDGVAPKRARPSVELKKVARFYREISSEGPRSHMALSQFPVTLTGNNGHTFAKPGTW